MFIKLLSVIVFIIPYLLLTSFYPDSVWYRFFSGPQHTAGETIALDVVALIFSGVLAVGSYILANKGKNGFSNIIEFLSDLQQKQKDQGQKDPLE